MMIEQIPLTFVVHNTMMICPATVGMLCHYKSLVLVWSHRILAHCITENLGAVPNIRISEVVVAVILESKRAFRLTTGQTFEAVYTKHLKLTVTPLYFFLRSVFGKFLHVVF